MDDVKQIEEVIEQLVKLHLDNKEKKKVFIVLNKDLILSRCSFPINSLCLHLVLKYRTLQWPKLCSVEGSKDLVLFIGSVD